MQVKLFSGFGQDGVYQMTANVNTWLMQNERKFTIVKTDTIMCSVGNPHEEIYQCIYTVIWYEAVKPRKQPQPQT